MNLQWTHSGGILKGISEPAVNHFLGPKNYLEYEGKWYKTFGC